MDMIPGTYVLVGTLSQIVLQADSEGIAVGLRASRLIIGNQCFPSKMSALLLGRWVPCGMRSPGKAGPKPGAHHMLLNYLKPPSLELKICPPTLRPTIMKANTELPSR